MSFSSYNPGDRYRRRTAKSMANLAVVMTILLLFFGFGFWLGKQNAGSQERLLKGQLQELSERNSQLEENLVDLRAEAKTALMRQEQLQVSFDEVLPEGPVRELLELVKAQLDEGRDPKRLAFLIRSARPPRNCTEAETKRFVVATPANQAAQSTITVADGGVVITASGVSAKNANGKPEAWFDPTRKVNIAFNVRDGQAVRQDVKKGIFPIHHSLVVGAREYRFTVDEGARSFATVTYDSCDYP